MKHILILSLIALIQLRDHAHAIECSTISDPKVKNMVQDLSNITVDEKFAGSCAVNEEIAKNASWKDQVETKLQRIQSKEFENLNQAYSDHIFEGKSISMELEKGNPPKDLEAFYKYKIKHNADTTNKMNIEKRLLRKKIKANEEKLRAMLKNKTCVHDAEFKLEAQNGVETSPEKVTSKEEALASIQKIIKENESGEGVTVCSSPELNYSGLTQVANKVHLELDDEVFFADNQWTFGETKSAKLKKMIDEKLKSNRPNCERKIRSAQIFTSSSLLRNQITDPLGNEYPQASWNFKRLSELRALEISNKLKEDYGIDQENIEAHFLGRNGDGTSGPCPYKLVKNKNGTYKVERNNIDEKELKKHRYGKISIEFDEVGDGCTKVEAPKATPNHYHFRSKCYSVILQCKSPKSR